MTVRPSIGWFFTICVTVACCVLMNELHKALQPQETGYSAEYYLRFNEIAANKTPLSTADLGEIE